MLRTIYALCYVYINFIIRYISGWVSIQHEMLGKLLWRECISVRLRARAMTMQRTIKIHLNNQWDLYLSIIIYLNLAKSC